MLLLTIDQVLSDPNLQACYLKYLSIDAKPTNSKDRNKKGKGMKDSHDFSRVLFLVNVEEYKKMLTLYSKDKSYLEEGKKEHSCKSLVFYALKIVQKYMVPNSFMNISLDKQIKFTSAIEKRLQTDSSCTLGSSLDLFTDVEVVVRKALEPSFHRFLLSKQLNDFVECCEGVQQKYSSIKRRIAANNDQLISTSENNTEVRAYSDTSNEFYLDLFEIINNKRLGCLFWLYTYSQRVHHSLSFWMDTNHHLIPLSEEILSCHLENSKKRKSFWKYVQFICKKYLCVGSPLAIPSISEENHLTHEKIESLAFSKNSENIHDNDEVIQNVMKLFKIIIKDIENNLRVNQIVKFLNSECIKEIGKSYQSTGSHSTELIESDTISTVSSHSSDSLAYATNLYQLLHRMGISFHEPQRILRNIHLSQYLSLKESRTISPISLFLNFEFKLSHHTNNGDRRTDLFTWKAIFQNPAFIDDITSTPLHLSNFFVPSGAEIIQSNERPSPKLFELTIGTSENPCYAVILVRYCNVQKKDIEMNPIYLAISQVNGKERNIYIPCGFCLTSKYPIFSTLRKRMNDFAKVLFNQEDHENNIHWIPSVKIVETCTAPLNQSIDIPLDSRLFPIDFSMKILFQCLSIRNIIALLHAFLLEKKILLISSYYGVLTIVSETLRSLIHPLLWSHTFAPILPKSMLECLHCPTPFLFGMHQSYAEEVAIDQIIDHGIVVELDKDSISGMQKKEIPKHLIQELSKDLFSIVHPQVAQSDSVSITDDVHPYEREFPCFKIRQCLHIYMLRLLEQSEYYGFQLNDDCDQVVVFDEERFLANRHVEDRCFYETFVKTQHFSHYISLHASYEAHVA